MQPNSTPIFTAAGNVAVAAPAPARKLLLLKLISNSFAFANPIP
jgi:hypothetical protein